MTLRPVAMLACSSTMNRPSANIQGALLRSAASAGSAEESAKTVAWCQLRRGQCGVRALSR
jgi:hypothetical protein